MTAISLHVTTRFPSSESRSMTCIWNQDENRSVFDGGIKITIVFVSSNDVLKIGLGRAKPTSSNQSSVDDSEGSTFDALKNAFPHVVIISSPILRFHQVLQSSSITMFPALRLRLPTLARASIRSHYQNRRMASTVTPELISAITQAERSLSNQDSPVAGGPAAVAQSHVGQPLTSQILHDIAMGERKITGEATQVKNGPAAIAQSILTQAGQTGTTASSGGSSAKQQTTGASGGSMTSEVISEITEAEKEITGSDDPVKKGPTAQAQKHANEPIDSQTLSDITQGEKKITGGERVPGGPTATAQSELSKSRQ